MKSSGRFASLPFGKSSALNLLGEHPLSGVGRATLSLAGEPQSEPQPPPTRTRTNIHTHPYTIHDTHPYGTHGIIHNDPMLLCKQGDFFQLFPFFFTVLTNKQHKAFVVSSHKSQSRDSRSGLLRQAQGTHDEHTTTHTVPAIAIGSVFP